MINTVKIIAGLLLAAVAQVLALGFAGGGHGWVTAVFASLALWVFLPVGFVFASPVRGYKPDRKGILLTLTFIGLISDISLGYATFSEGMRYFEKAFAAFAPWVFFWLAVWFSWQILNLITLTRGEAVADAA
ncbi:MAG: hypothetical protein ABIQ32_12985 [Sphingomicrobium sp.]